MREKSRVRLEGGKNIFFLNDGVERGEGGVRLAGISTGGRTRQRIGG